MSLFTLAYISRIGGFAFATAIVQGALVAACEIACRRAAANAAIDTRFRLTCAHFAGLLLLPLVSVAILQRSLSSGALESAPLLPPEYLSHGGGDPIRLTFVLLAVWLAGVVVMALILAKDLQKAVQLSGEPAEPALVEAVSRLAADWVHLPTVVQSPSVRAPEVRGFGRAILVTPMGFARMLAEDERDAVLLHELAHVKRSDFGWNVAQRMILALLWFHPAAWLLYDHIRRDREACCDALALRRGAPSHVLARALVQLAELARPAAAMSAAPRGTLTDRVQSLFNLEPPPPFSTGARLTSLGAFASCLLSLGFSVWLSRDPLIANLYVASAFGPTVNVTARDAAGPFALSIRQGRVVSATLDGRRLSHQQIRQMGEQVALFDSGRRSVMWLMVSPSGRVRWNSRS